MRLKLDTSWLYSSLLLLYSTFAIPYVGSIYAYFIIAIFFIVIVWSKKIFTKSLFYYLLFVFIYFCFLSLFHKKIEYYRFLYYFCWILVSYAFVKKKGYGIFYYIEKTIFYFAAISIPFYLIELMVPNVFYNLMSSVGVRLIDSIANSEHRISYNIIIYTVNAIPGEYPRNCGIYFEPGYHSCFIVISLMLNYFRLKKFINKQTIILLLVLVTTVSTTGFILYSFFIIFILFKTNKLKLYAFALVLISILYYYKFKFIHDKIFIAINQVNNYDDLFQKAGAWNSILHPDRLVSLQLGIIDLIKYPLWGRGELLSSLGEYYGGDIMPASGLAHLMMYYGISILIILSLCVWKLSNKMSKYYNLEYIRLFFPCFLLILSISYDVERPLFILLYMSGLMLKRI